MKRIKKILSMMFCSVVIIGGSKLTLVKANAQTINNDKMYNQQLNTRTTSNSVNVRAKSTVNNNERWRLGIELRLRDKIIQCYKPTWEIDLYCTNDGILMLDGCTNIPDKWTFDDHYVWGHKNNDTNNFEIITEFRPLNNVNPGCALERAKDLFNKARISDGDTIVMHGTGSTNSLKFKSRGTSVIHSNSGNDYSRGYETVYRFDVGLKVTKTGLEEVKFKHKI